MRSIFRYARDSYISPRDTCEYIQQYVLSTYLNTYHNTYQIHGQYIPIRTNTYQYIPVRASDGAVRGPPRPRQHGRGSVRALGACLLRLATAWRGSRGMYGPGEAANGHFDGFGAGRLVGGGGSHRRSEPDRPRTLVFGGSLAHGTESVQGSLWTPQGAWGGDGAPCRIGVVCVFVRIGTYVSVLVCTWYVLFPGVRGPFAQPLGREPTAGLDIRRPGSRRHGARTVSFLAAAAHADGSGGASTERRRVRIGMYWHVLASICAYHGTY